MRQLEVGREQLKQEQTRLQEMQRALKRQQAGAPSTQPVRARTLALAFWSHGPFLSWIHALHAFKAQAQQMAPGSQFDSRFLGFGLLFALEARTDVAGLRARPAGRAVRPVTVVFGRPPMLVFPRAPGGARDGAQGHTNGEDESMSAGCSMYKLFFLLSGWVKLAPWM